MPARVLIADHRSHIVRILEHRCRQAGLDPVVAEDIDDAHDALTNDAIAMVIAHDRFSNQWITEENASELPPFIMLTGAVTALPFNQPQTGPVLATFATPFRPGIVVRTARALINAESLDRTDEDSTDTSTLNNPVRNAA